MYMAVECRNHKDFLKMARFVRKVQDVCFKDPLHGTGGTRYVLNVGGQLISYLARDSDTVALLDAGLGKEDGGLDYSVIEAGCAMMIPAPTN